MTNSGLTAIFLWAGLEQGLGKLLDSGLNLLPPAWRSWALIDLDDWVAALAEFENGTTGVMESSKLCTGRGEGGRSLDYCEVNGTEGTLVYSLGKPLELEIGRRNGTHLDTVAVPGEFLVWPGSPRQPREGDPLVTFRYDQSDGK